jgi:hypothetical protein
VKRRRSKERVGRTATTRARGAGTPGEGDESGREKARKQARVRRVGRRRRRDGEKERERKQKERASERRREEKKKRVGRTIVDRMCFCQRESGPKNTVSNELEVFPSYRGCSEQSWEDESTPSKLSTATLIIERPRHWPETLRGQVRYASATPSLSISSMSRLQDGHDNRSGETAMSSPLPLILIVV